MLKDVMSNPRSYFIIGCGHFGSRAVEKLLRKNSRPKITVVDREKKAIQKISSLPVEAKVGEGVSYLHQSLLKGRVFDYIIPAVPLHLAFEFLLFTLKPYGVKKRKVSLPPGLPNAVIGKTGDLYTSLADFLCPEDCSEPSQFCTVTGKRRPKPLYKILTDLRGPFESRVIRSQQLGLGVGGFKPEALMDLAEAIKKRRDPDRLILISTACRCHGVTSALSF